MIIRYWIEYRNGQGGCECYGRFNSWEQFYMFCRIEETYNRIVSNPVEIQR